MADRVPRTQDNISAWRRTKHRLAPARHAPVPPGAYDIYPANGTVDAIDVGVDPIVRRIARADQVRIDGYVGVFWEDLRQRLDQALQRLGVRANWVDVADAMKSESEIERSIAPALGGDDPLFGKRFTGRLIDFYDAEKLRALRPDARARLNILYGCGAALAGWTGPLVYVDLPKNELQYRSRAGVVCNLGAAQPEAPKRQYKRFYFADWVALNRHKHEIIDRVDLFVDGQRPDEVTSADGAAVRSALSRLSRTVFRVRPWFEPGPWGGQWIKQRVPTLPRDAPNYAWSFELIVPENGLMLSDGKHALELSFDWLMYRDHHAVLGDCAGRFGREFPIRYDFLDTHEGGHLSVQVHPRADYMRQHFGESFTQDETYYVLDTQPGASIFLGFREGVDPAALRRELERSLREGIEIEAGRFINAEPAEKHGLYLIPNGTVHSSGRNNIVLEISSTPYIFTFKMYDWMRMDLDGRPRPMNIERAYDNVYFDRQGRRVAEEFVSRPREIARGDGWRLMHLPTHEDHFYDLHRYEFDREVIGDTAGSPHVMMLVEGSSVVLETASGQPRRFSYSETFVIPAAAGRYRLINEGPGRALVVKTFIKPGIR